MIAGIAGHQDLENTNDWLKNTTLELLHSYQITSGITSLAAGADQLFAECLLNQQIPFDVIVPCTGYESTFKSEGALRKFQTYILLARQVARLNYPEPSEQAFWHAGQAVVDGSSLLFAIWDGLASKGLGGTADIVEYAVKTHRLVIHLHPTQRSVRTISDRQK